MMDENYSETGIRKEQMGEEVERVLKFLKENVFVKLGI
jgi:hypothetical protein